MITGSLAFASGAGFWDIHTIYMSNHLYEGFMKNLKMKALAQMMITMGNQLMSVANEEKTLYNSNLTEDEIDSVMESLAKFNQDRVSKDGACKLLGMSRTTFNRKLKEGVIPPGHKERGWKELSWSKSEIERLVNHPN